ncbi:hypothetical protein CIW49_22150 [Mycolicibacterium sp. P1-18]|uniref:hypothetical protein n=1 Tax=Mycolicibacterium sp. P1-18 TaxID=2024615 RepID=UPI0011F2805C|nr:hypothetical protein [Mycolicibacterium sp. P1-18]KAA0095194.1 hypothetical protein CIW49_22150 [Mycolicibacterium sp. P1-18]
MTAHRTTLFAAAVVVSAAAFASVGVADAAPSGPSRAEDVVRSLEASGYHVIVNRVGTGQLSSCTVTSVQPGQTYSTTDSRGGSSPAVTVFAKTMHVDLAC